MTAQSKFGMSLNSIIHTTLRDRQVLLGSFLDHINENYYSFAKHNIIPDSPGFLLIG